MSDPKQVKGKKNIIPLSPVITIECDFLGQLGICSYSLKYASDPDPENGSLQKNV